MQRSDFNYDLPEALIAQEPLADRAASRLLMVDAALQTLTDGHFAKFIDWLRPGDLVVFNDTKVLPARLYGKKATGGQVEVLLERLLDEGRALVQIRASKSPRHGALIHLADGDGLEVLDRQGAFFEVRGVTERSVEQIFEECGAVPLPPYIARPADDADTRRYQTVYAKTLGAVAAPTAGLHFDQATLNAMDEKGVARGFVTLHVGAGTFQPVRVDELSQHQMHRERYWVGQSLAAQWRDTRARGDRVVAVGTTTVRCLEAAMVDGAVLPGSGDTEIFIYPGRRVECVDALLTNFHLPESTLIMMVAAMAGYDLTMSAYRHAVDQCYRFFSYGDAMLVDGIQQ